MLNSWSHSETSESYEREKAVRQARKDAILRGELPRQVTMHDHIVCDDPVLHDKDLE